MWNICNLSVPSVINSFFTLNNLDENETGGDVHWCIYERKNLEF